MMIAAPVLALTPVPMAVITTKSVSGTKYKVNANKSQKTYKNRSISDALYGASNKYDDSKRNRALQKDLKKRGISENEHRTIANDNKMKQLNRKSEKVASDYYHRKIDKAEYDRQTNEIRNQMDNREKEVLSDIRKKKQK